MKIKVTQGTDHRSGENWKEGDILQMNNDPSRLFILTRKLPKEKQTIAGHVLFDALDVREDKLYPSTSCFYRAESFILFTGTVTLSN